MMVSSAITQLTPPSWLMALCEHWLLLCFEENEDHEPEGPNPCPSTSTDLSQEDLEDEESILVILMKLRSAVRNNK